tara:strand:- start:15969 stop:16343 length:375 start_codon:yes stop_codon:yes gene_type:complete
MAAIGRNTVKSGSSNPYEIVIESTPVSGVEMRNDIVAPRDAPLRRIAIAVGNTLHEQSGRGNPMSVDFNTDQKLLFPIDDRIKVSGSKILAKPASANPNKKKVLESISTFHISPKILTITKSFI